MTEDKLCNFSKSISLQSRSSKMRVHLVFVLIGLFVEAFAGPKSPLIEGHVGDDIIVSGAMDDSIKVTPSKELDSGPQVCKIDIGYPPRRNGMYYTSWKESYPKCLDHEYYGGLCDLDIPHSKKCPYTKCCYTTKTATLATSHGTRMTVELRTPYTMIAWQCKDMKKNECSKNCRCSTIWCKTRKQKTIKVYKKYYAMETVYIPYPCGCQCRSTIGRDPGYGG